jgi:cobalt-zinc-cadmium efflux system outer membrane protein
MTFLRAGLRPALLHAFACCASLAHADTLTLQQALERATASNPSLAAQAAETESAGARAARESLAPPVMLDTEVENVAGSGQLRGFDAAETTVSVSRLIELGGKRAGRRALGDVESALAGNALVNARLDLRKLTTQRFVEVVADQERLALAGERETLAERTRREVERVVGHARNPETDLRAAEISRADAELEREHAEHELRAARVALAATWGARDPDFAAVSMPLLTLPEPEPLEALAARLPASAALRGAKLASEAAAARARLAGSETRPDLRLSLGVRHFQAFGDQGLVMGISLPLGTAARGRLALSESRARFTAAERWRESLEVETYQQLYERYQELGHARTEFEMLEKNMIPKAEQALALATRGFEAGRFPYLVLTQSQQTLFELRRRRIDAAHRYHTIFAETQRLVAAAETP